MNINITTFLASSYKSEKKTLKYRARKLAFRLGKQMVNVVYEVTSRSLHNESLDKNNNYLRETFSLSWPGWHKYPWRHVLVQCPFFRLSVEEKRYEVTLRYFHNEIRIRIIIYEVRNTAFILSWPSWHRHPWGDVLVWSFPFVLYIKQHF